MPSSSQFHHLLVIKDESLFLCGSLVLNGITLPEKLVDHFPRNVLKTHTVSRIQGRGFSIQEMPASPSESLLPAQIWNALFENGQM